jgi:sugar diacid utilization regulator/GAF domain-containing protein
MEPFIEGGINMSLKDMIRNDKIERLLETNKLLTRSFNVEFVLKTMVQAAYDLVDISDTIILYLYDEKDNVLRFAEGVGVDLEILKNIAFAPGESLTGRTYSTRKSQLFAKKDDIQENMANISEENYYYYFKGVGEREVRSAFCVPLLYQDECLGVIVMDNFETDDIFTEDEINIIKIIADQSSIAIVNSRLYHDLKNKNEQLHYSLNIHHKFTEIILDGGGINKILSLLSRILEDEAQFKVSIDLDHEKYYFPIIRGKETLGYIKLSKQHIGFITPLNMVAIEQAATALTLELVKQNALYEKELHFREEMFQQMIDGMPQSEIKHITEKLELDYQDDFECVVIEGRKETLWRPEATLDKERFVRRIETICKSFYNTSFVFTKAFQTVMVVPVKNKTMTKELVKAINIEIGEDKGMVFGIGRKTVIHNLIDSYREAVEAVRYGKRVEKGSYINYSELGVERLWQKIDQPTLDFYVSDQLGPLLAMNIEYFETLATFIETNKNHKLTADRLHIHPNTLYHRLRKIEKALNIEFDRENDWLNLVVAYQIHVTVHTN